MAEFFTSLGLTGISSVLSAVIVFLICLIAIKLLMKIFNLLLDKSRHIDNTVKSFLRTAIRIALWALAIVIIADALGIPTASLVAVISIVGLALSLSVQNIMSNLFSGITLLLTRPFNVGDYITVGENTGTVRSISLFYTVIITLSNQSVSIPNSDVTAGPVRNMGKIPSTAITAEKSLRRIEHTFTASYDDSTEAVRSAILYAVESDSRILTVPAPAVYVNNYGESSIEYVTYVWCREADYWGVYYSLNENVRESFIRHGITMTYNHVNVHIIP